MPFDIPDSWSWTRFNSAVINRDGERKPISKALREHRQGQYDYYGASGVIDSIDDYLFDKPLMLVGEDGANLLTRRTPIAFIARGKYWVNNHAHVLDGISESFLEFISQFINSISLAPYVTGTAQPKMNQAKMNSIMVAIAPENEQIRILEKINHLFSKVDTYKSHYQNLDKLNKEFPEKLRKSILQYAMQGKLVPQDPNDEPVEVLLEKIRQEKQKLFEEGKLRKKDLQESIIYKGDDNSYYEKIPESWKIVSLGTIGKITSGGTPRSTEPKFYDGDIIWITPADMGKQQDSICFGDSVKHISILGLNSSSAQRIEGNSIVYSSRAPIGHINIVKSPYTTNQGCKSVTPYQVNVEWLYHTIKNETPNIIKEASGTTFLEVSATKFSETYVSLPPLEEQQRITVKVDSLNQMISQFDRLS
ncbi:restriction endonuclease subunit S [Lactococcus petauri]|uniref:restriction endonuclease subunit S n=1 Tax=Lactococcus petauri TaxID=1940789 RepID=UPI0038524A44